MRLATGLVAVGRRVFSAVSMATNCLRLAQYALQSADLFIGKRLRSWSYSLSEARQDRCIDPICFGESARSPCELSCLARVDHRYGQALGSQSPHHRALQASGGLQDHQLGVLLEE